MLKFFPIGYNLLPGALALHLHTLKRVMDVHHHLIMFEILTKFPALISIPHPFIKFYYSNLDSYFSFLPTLHRIANFSFKNQIIIMIIIKTIITIMIITITLIITVIRIIVTDNIIYNSVLLKC